jgi:hypothetical protein
MSHARPDPSPGTISSRTFNGISKEMLHYESENPEKLLSAVRSMSQVLSSLRELDLSSIEPAVIFRLELSTDDWR